jgi:hypothetical protein
VMILHVIASVPGGTGYGSLKPMLLFHPHPV